MASPFFHLRIVLSGPCQPAGSCQAGLHHRRRGQPAPPECLGCGDVCAGKGARRPPQHWGGGGRPVGDQQRQAVQQQVVRPRRVRRRGQGPAARETSSRSPGAGQMPGEPRCLVGVQVGRAGQVQVERLQPPSRTRASIGPASTAFSSARASPSGSPRPPAPAAPPVTARPRSEHQPTDSASSARHERQHLRRRLVQPLASSASRPAAACGHLASRPSTASRPEPVRAPALTPNAVRTASACGTGSTSSRSSSGAHTWCSPRTPAPSLTGHLRRVRPGSPPPARPGSPAAPSCPPPARRAPPAPGSDPADRLDQPSSTRTPPAVRQPRRPSTGRPDDPCTTPTYTRPRPAH